MNIEFSTQSGSRILNNLSWICVRNIKSGRSLWHQESTNSWVCPSSSEWDNRSTHSNHHSEEDCHFPKSYKALLKYLNKHKELIGCEIEVCTRTKTQWQVITITL